MDELRCPSCGADVSFRGGDLTVCPYCGSQLHFGSQTDPAELAKLRNINYGYRQQYSPEAEEYVKKKKKWQTGNGIFLGLLMLLMVFAELFILFWHKMTGGALIIIAAGIFLVTPIVRGAKYPVRDDADSSASKFGKKAGVTAALYAVGALAVVIAVIVGAVIAVIMGYDPESEKESKKKAAEYSDDADDVVNRWFESNYSLDDDELYWSYEVQSPDDIWDEDKDSDDTVMMVEYQKAHTNAALKDYDIDLKEIEQLDELTGDEISGAEAYFRERFDEDIEVTVGYGYHAVFTAKPKEDGKSKKYDDYCCAVRLNGSDGWKIIPADPEELEDYLDYDDDEDDEEYTDDYDDEE